MSTQPSSSSFGLGPILIVAGACVAALGAVIPWAKLTIGSTHVTAAGARGWEGKMILILCAGMVVRGVITVRGSRRLGPMVVIGALAIVGIASYTLVTMHHQIVSDGIAELQKTFPTTTPEAIRSVIEQMVAVGTITISAQPGIFLCILGGIAGALGGLMTVMESRAVVPSTDGPVPQTAGVPNGAPASPWIGGSVQAPLATADTADAWAAQHANAPTPASPQRP